MNDVCVDKKESTNATPSLDDASMTVFYDGSCPLCNWEIGHLKNNDRNQRIQFENIHCDDFAKRYPNLDKQRLDDLLHVKQANGQWQTGLDANYLLWQTVGYGKWFSPLKWAWLRPILTPCYLLFAKHRHRITAWLFKKKKVALEQTHSSKKDTTPL